MPRRQRPELNDPTIPRKRAIDRRGNAGERQTPPGPVEGILVDYGSKLVLRDSRGNTWDQDRVRLLAGDFGSCRDGTERAPRAWVFDQGSGSVLVEGDLLLIDFLDGDADKPFIRGGVRPLIPEDDSFFSGQSIGQDANRYAFRQVQLDAAGVQSGHFDIEAFADGTQQRLEIRVGGALLNGGKCRILLDFKAGVISIGDGNEDERVILGDEFLTDYKGVVDDLIAAAAAAGSSAVNTVAVSAKLGDPDAYRGKVKVS
jgi:hypothetical protein